MSFNDFYQRFTPFGLAFALGLFAAAFFYGTNVSSLFKCESKPAPKIAVSAVTNGDGASGCCDNGVSESETSKWQARPSILTKGVKILSKPRANYTEEARAGKIRGKVVLRVTFMASGKIGAIIPVTELPEGLTEQAIAAARKIEFEPAKRGNVPYSVTKPVEYTFTIY